MTEIQDREPKRKENAEKKKRFIQAFKQAPWRNHVQVAGFFLLSLVILLLVASVYLSISGQAAAAGLEAYRLNLDRTDLERQIADRKSQLANLTSSPSMEKRALDMGFERIDHLVKSGQMHLKAVKRGPGRMKLEKPFFHPLLEIDADGVHVPNDLAGRFLEGKIEAALTALAGAVGKGRRQTCFACTRRT